jgi:hypothetical protein
VPNAAAALPARSGSSSKRSEQRTHLAQQLLGSLHNSPKLRTPQAKIDVLLLSAQRGSAAAAADTGR